MWFDGRKFRRANHLSWRNSDPSRDVDLWGNPVRDNYYIAIVKRSDCSTYEENGRTYLKTEDAPSVPLDHGGTNYAYGKSRKYLDHWTRPMYLVHDNKVYVSTIHYNKKPNDYEGE